MLGQHLCVASVAALLMIARPLAGYADAVPSFNCDGPGANLQTKIDGVADGATIFFGGNCDDGPYRITGKDVSLRGFSSGGTLSAAEGGECVVEVSFAHVNFSRLAIDAAGTQAGICVHFGSVEIDGTDSLTIANSQGNGITALGGSIVVVRDTYIVDNAAHGILLATGSSAEIAGNRIEDSGDIGINLDTGSHAFIAGNDITHSGTSGIWVQINSGAEILGNYVAHSGDHGIGVVSSGSARLSGENTIENNAVAGVTVDRNGSVRLSGVNLIQANNFGLLCGESGSLEQSFVQDFGTGNTIDDTNAAPGCHYP
jgi:hypothetical protein